MPTSTFSQEFNETYGEILREQYSHSVDSLRDLTALTTTQYSRTFDAAGGVLSMEVLRRVRDNLIYPIQRDTTLFGTAQMFIQTKAPRPKVTPYLSNQGTECWI